MPTEVYWAVLPPALVSACVLLLTARRPREAGLIAAVAAGYAVGHWGVAGLRWGPAEAALPWTALAAGAVEIAAGAWAVKAKAVPFVLQLCLSGLAAGAVVAGAPELEHGPYWTAGLGLLGYAAWILLGAGSPGRLASLAAWPPVVASLALSIVLLHAGSLKLALLAAALTSALGVALVVAWIRKASVAGAHGTIAVVYTVLIGNGYFFADLKPMPGALLLGSLVLPARIGAERRPWIALLAALLPAGAAIALSWSPPGE